MRALVQRVSHASVTIDGRIHGQIGQGFLVLLGITDGDTVDDAVYLADKTVKMRVFTDENDKMNRSLADVGGGLLIVSQFTLYGDCRKGNRPSFTNAARPETAIPLYEAFIARCRESGLPVETGEFGADMKVDLLNDGPVTLWMDTKDCLLYTSPSAPGGAGGHARRTEYCGVCGKVGRQGDGVPPHAQADRNAAQDR